jgi:hypothetical protein
MQEGPVDLAAPSNPDAVIKPEIQQPTRPHPVPQMMIMPTPGRLDAEHQRVHIRNTGAQTHIVVDRHYNGVEIAPGQTVEVDMLVEDIASFQELARPDRGVYTSGHLVGKPLPQHPLRIIDVPAAIHPQHQSFLESDEAIRRANEAAAAAAAVAAQATQSEREAESRGRRR